MIRKRNDLILLRLINGSLVGFAAIILRGAEYCFEATFRSIRCAKKNKGFSLIELLVGVAILSISLGGLLGLFIYCSKLVDLSGNMTKALRGAQGKLEEIRNHTYSLITTDYAAGGTPGNKFDVTQLNGKGAVYIDSTNANLLKVKVVVSWRNENNWIIGEDLSLNGVLDAGEDKDGNGELDSPVSLVSLIAQR